MLVCYNKNGEIPDVGASALSARIFDIEGKAGLPRLAFFVIWTRNYLHSEIMLTMSNAKAIINESAWKTVMLTPPR